MMLWSSVPTLYSASDLDDESILPDKNYQLTVYGHVCFPEGIGRQTIGLIDCLKDDLKINFIPSRGTDYIESIPASCIDEKTRNILLNSNQSAGTVCIFEDILWYQDFNPIENLPKSKIKIAYSMLESTQIPPQWVDILNKNFDAVVVLDSFLVSVYQNSGVVIPIFVLPLGVYIDDFLQKPQRTSSHTPFVFGSTVAYNERKNYHLLIQAFIEEFGNSPDVILKIMGAI